MDKSHGHSAEEAAVRDVFESWTAAVRRRDIEGILKNHSPDIVMFDVPPPFQSRGIEAYRKTWDTFYSWSSDPIPFEVTDISITYVRLETSDGALSLPNAQVLAAAVGPARSPAAQPAAMAAWQPGNPLPGDPDSPSPHSPSPHSPAPDLPPPDVPPPDVPSPGAGRL